MTENIPKFQPMPKRFMVWDKENGRFYKVKEAYPQTSLTEDRAESNVFELLDLINLAAEIGSLGNIFVEIVQSTNLFDKDGKEIFEGSILEEDLTHLRAGRKYHFIVKYVNAEFTAEPIDGVEFRPAMLPNTTKSLRVIGHILTNPELLEKQK